MVCFDRVTADFTKEHIDFRDAWILIESTLTGGLPLFRGQTAMRDGLVAVFWSRSEEFDVAPELENQEYREPECQKRIKIRLRPTQKKPDRISLCEHSIETGNTTPINERGRRIPSKWEVEVERKLEEMVANGVCSLPNHVVR